MSDTHTESKELTRGQLARELDCNAETIRYYEQINLLPPPSRAVNGYRVYGVATVRRLRFLLRARELGFTISELRSMLGLVDGGDYTCGDIRAITIGHLEHVRRKIIDLQRLERTLAGIASKCAGGSVPECPIIDALYEVAAGSV